MQMRPVATLQSDCRGVGRRARGGRSRGYRVSRAHDQIPEFGCCPRSKCGTDGLDVRNRIREDHVRESSPRPQPGELPSASLVMFNGVHHGMSS